MLDDQECHRRIEREQEAGKRPTFGRRQTGRRLVEHQDFRSTGEAERDLELALLTVGERSGRGVEPVCQADPIGHLARSCSILAILAQPHRPHVSALGPQDREVDVLEDGEHSEQP